MGDSPDAVTYYAQLEQGARFLAGRALDESERLEHLGWANRYRRMRAEAGGSVPLR